MSKHTKGPWRISSRGKRKARISGIDWTSFASVYVVLDGEENAEGHANARLIAAAPMLYEALKALLQDTQHAKHNCGDPECPVDLARAALRAAEGAE